MNCLSRFDAGRTLHAVLKQHESTPEGRLCQTRFIYFHMARCSRKMCSFSSFGRLLKSENDAMPGYKQSMLEITDPDPTDSVVGKVFEIIAAALDGRLRLFMVGTDQGSSGVRAWS